MDQPAHVMRSEEARIANQRWPANLAFTVLLVGASPEEASLLEAELALSGAALDGALGAAAALVRFGETKPDAILMSADLDEVEPSTWIRAVRDVSPVPILLGVCPGQADAAGPLLVDGATAVVSRPYRSREVLDRLSDWHGAAVRRHESELRIRVGPLELDAPAFSVHLRGEEVVLSLREFQLLRCLMINADRVVSSQEIGEALWGAGPGAPSRDAIKLHISRLRRHLGDESMVRTVRGRGYTLSHLRTLV